VIKLFQPNDVSSKPRPERQTLQARQECPLYPQKQTFSEADQMSAKCRNRRPAALSLYGLSRALRFSTVTVSL